MRPGAANEGESAGFRNRTGLWELESRRASPSARQGVATEACLPELVTGTSSFDPPDLNLDPPYRTSPATAGAHRHAPQSPPPRSARRRSRAPGGRFEQWTFVVSRPGGRTSETQAWAGLAPLALPWACGRLACPCVLPWPSSLYCVCVQILPLTGTAVALDEAHPLSLALMISPEDPVPTHGHTPGPWGPGRHRSATTLPLAVCSFTQSWSPSFSPKPRPRLLCAELG